MLVRRALFPPICGVWSDGLRIDRVQMCNEHVGVTRLCYSCLGALRIRAFSYVSGPENLVR
jgi:hypothetical protein